MAERKILQHLRSAILNAAPTATQLEYGELAINYAKGSEKIYLKNSENEIIGIGQDDQFEYLSNEVSNHLNDKNNPHKVTVAQLGLDKVDNTSDANKPVSTAMQEVLDTKLDYAIYDDLVVDTSHPEYVYTAMEWSSLQAYVLYNLIQSQLDPDRYLSDLEKRVEALEAVLKD